MDVREWEEKYYSTPGAKERKKLLDERLEWDEPSEELELIQKLYDIRYIPEKKEPEQIDHMLRGMMYLKLMRNQKGLFSRVPKKDIQGIYKDLGRETAESYGETGRRVWYRELNHLGKTFLNINKDDRLYNSTIWGFGQLKDPVLKAKLARDIYTAAYQSPRELGITKELEVFTSAVTAAYNELFPEDMEMLRCLIREEKVL